MTEEVEQTEHKKPLRRTRSYSGRVFWLQTPAVNIYCEDADSNIVQLANLSFEVFKRVKKIQEE